MKKYKALLLIMILAVVALAWFLPLVFAGLVVVMVALRLCYRTKVGEATRFNPNGGGTPGERWYIEGTVPGNGAGVSCSFVEFDGRGDFLEFEQYKNAYERVRDLAMEKPVVLVVYCHGWKHTAQSGDAIKFNDFLIRLAGSDQMRTRGARVHGLYLGWRGNVFKPHVSGEDKQEAIQRTTAAYGGPVTNEMHQRGRGFPWSILEQLTYWSRKHAAEAQVSGVPMARAIFACANVAKRVGHAQDNTVVVIGHSFGALMLERCLGQATVGMLSTELNWFGEERVAASADKAVAAEETAAGASVAAEALKVKAVEGGMSMPIDLILFVNSAAPSIYAKVLDDFLTMYRSALSTMKARRKDAPVIVSVTSTKDLATGAVHPVGNWLAPLSRSMNRIYRSVAKSREEVKQSFYYARTPGHNPLLVNHWIEPVPAATGAAGGKVPSADEVLNANLDVTVSSKEALTFQTSARDEKHPFCQWRIVAKEPEDLKWRTEDDLNLLGKRTGYWMVRCLPEIISDHNDVWNANAMEMYAAIFRLVQKRRGE